MASRRYWSAGIIVSLVLLCGCSGSKPVGLTIREAGALTLYEGLPHQAYEAEVLAAEKEAKPTIDLKGFPFYRQTLELKPGDEEKLRAVLGDARSYKPHAGEKKCGGFHPDYAIGWSVESEQFMCLVCFGCSEFKLYWPAGEGYYDMTGEVKEQLKDVLASYQQNRPPRTTPCH